jgi:hypothetical protein
MNIQGQILVKSKLTQRYQLNPGSISEGKIIVKNNSKQKTLVRLYKRDYSFDYNGNNYYSKPGSNKRTNSEWIYLSKNEIKLLPLEEKIIKYMIKIPESKNYSGTYWSMIMVEQNSIISDSNSNNHKQNIGFKQNIRYGVQIITNFSTNEKINLVYKDAEVKKVSSNTYKFKLAVLNNNIYLLDCSSKLILINRNTGNIKSEYVSKKRKLYPNTSIKIEKGFNLKENIPYKIVAITGNEKYGYHGKEYTVEVENN